MPFAPPNCASVTALILKAHSGGKVCARIWHLLQKVGVSKRGVYTYSLCGLHTRSDIPLTSISSSQSAGASADILIQIAPGHPPAAKNLNRGVLEHSGEGWLIKIQGVADYEVIRGREIRVWPATGATQKDIEIFLSGLVWATLCHQRGLLPLHASAVTTKGGIVAFAGPSGSGKSTTAALMGTLGYELVTDDMLPISFNREAVPGAWPYLRRLKLHDRAVVQLALTSTDVVSEELDKEKYYVCPKNVADDKWNRLDRIYLLENDSPNSRASIEQITGAETVRALVDQTYYLDFVLDSQLFRDHLALCTQLASKIPIYRLRLSPSLRIEEKFGSLVRAHLEDVAK
jgi:hypothetical protein